MAGMSEPILEQTAPSLASSSASQPVSLQETVPRRLHPVPFPPQDTSPSNPIPEQKGGVRTFIAILGAPPPIPSNDLKPSFLSKKKSNSSGNSLQASPFQPDGSQSTDSELSQSSNRPRSPGSSSIFRFDKRLNSKSKPPHLPSPSTPPKKLSDPNPSFQKSQRGSASGPATPAISSSPRPPIPSLNVDELKRTIATLQSELGKVRAEHDALAIVVKQEREARVELEKVVADVLRTVWTPRAAAPPCETFSSPTRGV
ncbi:hypothetical protein BJ742DRAFT_821478 [Cladochytrium replicatum]|nr:hypothetical protein BJ742DRAFT_821478 [Cladochytrium replicatum]